MKYFHSFFKKHGKAIGISFLFSAAFAGMFAVALLFQTPQVVKENASPWMWFAVLWPVLGVGIWAIEKHTSFGKTLSE